MHTRNSRWRLPVATLLVGPLTVGLLLAGGGCPVQRAAVDDNGTVPFSDAGTGGVVDADYKKRRCLANHKVDVVRVVAVEDAPAVRACFDPDAKQS